MSNKKKKKTAQKPKKSKDVFIFDKFRENKQDLVFIGLIIIFLSLFFYQLSFLRLQAAGVDVVASAAKTHQIKEFEQNTGETALYQPYIFAGMPFYHHLGPRAWSLDDFIRFFYKIFSYVVTHYIVGAIGVYLLLRILKISPLLSFTGALIFVLSPHFAALWQVGHMKKVRALFYMPWVVLTFHYLMEKRNIKTFLFFCIAVALQLRTQHYQIIFYTAMYLLISGIAEYISIIKEDKKEFIKLTVFFILAPALTLVMTLQPLLIAKEYLPYSTRGGNSALETAEQRASTEKGVGLDYATGWSFAPKELIRLVMPYFYGGKSGQPAFKSVYYKGQKIVSEGQATPGYWGPMPFTQSIEYIGIILVFLSMIAIAFHKRRKLIYGLTAFTIFAVLLSFGRHFESFYKIFFLYVPYFDKFRVPLTMLTTIFLSMTVLGIMGAQVLLKREYNKKRMMTLIYIMAGISVIVLAYPVLFKGSLSMISAKEAGQLNPQYTEAYKTIRYSFIQSDIQRFFLLSFVFLAGLWFYVKEKLSRTLFITALSLVLILDFSFLSKNEIGELHEKENADKYFTKGPIEETLLKDDSYYRVLCIGEIFQQNEFAYYFRLLNGYSAIKMQTIQDIIEHNIYTGTNSEFPVNENILKMFNTKYLISPQRLKESNFIKRTAFDNSKKLIAYEYTGALPGAYFVDSLIVEKDFKKTLDLFNRSDFDAASAAVIHQEIDINIESDSVKREVSVAESNPNLVRYDISEGGKGFLLISEMYYPLGWKAYLDGEEIKLYRTNYALNGAVIPEGKHTLELRFEPARFNTFVFYTKISMYLVLAAAFGLIVFDTYKKKKNNEV